MVPEARAWALGLWDLGMTCAQVHTCSAYNSYGWSGLASGYRDVLHEVPDLRIPQM